MAMLRRVLHERDQLRAENMELRAENKRLKNETDQRGNYENNERGEKADPAGVARSG